MKHWQDCELPDNNLFPDQYSVLELISESSASSVLLGFDEKEGNKVIIKCFKNNSKSAYLREISAVYDMRHQYLVRCLNTFRRKDGISCLVYEYMPDGTLADLLEAKEKVGIEFIFRCLNDILRALIYLHAQSRIHCDIKPANIFLRKNANGSIDFVLGDLGAACFLREAQEGNHVVGTPAYIAPERIRNQFYYNSDLYSLGVVAFELYTGYRPFMGTVEEITQANLTEIPSLEDIEYQPLRDLIDHLLVKSPQKRIETASVAYSYLSKLQSQQESIGSKTEHLANQAFKSSLCSPYGSLPVFEFPLNVSSENSILAIQCLHTIDRILIALTYSSYTDIIDPRYPNEIVKTLMHTNFIQVTGAASIAYSTPTRIQQFDFNSGKSKTLIEKINNPKKFYFNNNKLVFVDDFNVSYIDLADNCGFSFRSSNYLFNPIVSLYANGSLCLSEGMVNEKLVKRDKTGALILEWQMNGPITAMTNCVDEFILGASLSINDQNLYSIWCLRENGQTADKILTEKIKQISCTDNAIYWLTQDGDLVSCCHELENNLIRKCAPNTAKFAISRDELYYCTLDFEAHNQAMLRLFKKGES
jgi:serine/threonine protein kinase